MARIQFITGPQEPDQPEDGIALVDYCKSDLFEEYVFQFPNGELETRRKFFHPRDNRERTETAATWRLLKKKEAKLRTSGAAEKRRKEYYAQRDVDRAIERNKQQATLRAKKYPGLQQHELK
jgi:hypothetical protein